MRYRSNFTLTNYESLKEMTKTDKYGLRGKKPYEAAFYVIRNPDQFTKDFVDFCDTFTFAIMKAMMSGSSGESE